MHIRFSAVIALLFVAASAVRAADYRIEPLDEAPPADALSAEIAAQLQPSGFRVVRGENRTICDVWLCKAWNVKADFTPSNTILYPFEPGQLLGVIRYPRKAGDFRAQDIAPGVYTMRYALQPVDGNHVGTSETRDFILLSRAADDADPGAASEEQLIERSAAAAETTHPAMLAMLSSQVDGDAPPAVRNDEERELVSLRLDGKSDDDKDVLIEIVVVGASEG